MSLIICPSSFREFAELLAWASIDSKPNLRRHEYVLYDGNVIWRSIIREQPLPFDRLSFSWRTSWE